jgi:hypothetical protein
MKKLLIYVPTFNGGDRLKYFINRFIIDSKGFESDVDLHLSDNCSDNFDPPVGVDNVFHSINSYNIGGVRNLNKVFTLNSNYEYTWILGDDDYLLDGSIARILAIIKNFNPFFVFLNTVTYPIELKDAVISDFNNSGNLPVANSVVKSSIGVNDIVHTKFSDLINSRVDDVLLGSLMCSVFKSEAVKDFSSESFGDPKKVDIFSTYPHVINYAKSLPPDSYSIFDPFVHTFNFWSGGNGWRDYYDIVVGLGLLYSIKTYYDNNFLTDDVERDLIKHYFAIGGKSLYNLNSKFDVEVASQASVVMPYLIDAIIRLRLI